MNKLVTGIERLTVLSIVGVLGAAFFTQFVWGELPCPLCLFQRMGFLAIAFGLLANAYYGPRALHYGLSFLGVIYTQLAAGTQVLRHIAPGDPGFSFPLFGIHLYTWAFCAASVYAGILTLLLILRSPSTYVNVRYRTGSIARCDKILFGLIMFLALVNFLSAFVECRFGLCPANPVEYELLSWIKHL